MVFFENLVGHRLVEQGASKLFGVQSPLDRLGPDPKKANLFRLEEERRAAFNQKQIANGLNPTDFGPNPYLYRGVGGGGRWANPLYAAFLKSGAQGFRDLDAELNKSTDTALTIRPAESFLAIQRDRDANSSGLEIPNVGLPSF